MIHPRLDGEASAAEHWAFELLLDLSRLLPAADDQADAVRVVLAEPGATTDFSAEPGRIRIGRRLLQQVVDVGGAAAEQRATERDRHGRVPATANPQVRDNSERALPLHQWATALARAVKEAAGSSPVFHLDPWPDGKRWAAAITHDLDIVSGWPLFAALRWTELIQKGEGSRALSAMASSAGGLGGNPVRESLKQILDIERASAVRSTWFVLSGEPTLAGWRRGDITYRLEGPAARRLVARILRDGHEIGLHGSFETRDRAELMAAERARVERVTGKAPRGVRQHFLRLDPSRTMLNAEAAGFTYDASFGFADRNAYRLGAADVLGLWNEAAQRPLKLQEAPLIWMDRTHSKYLGQEDPASWVSGALDLAGQVREAGGLWVGLWHPNVSAPLGFPGALEAFAQLVEHLAAEDPWFATLDQMVTWRVARRTLRGRLHGGGRLEVTASHPGSWSAGLRDATGYHQSFAWPANG